MKSENEKLWFKYAEALSLYRETEMTQKEICENCKVSVYGFRSFIYKYCRKDLLKKNNINKNTNININIKLRGKKGQGINAHEKYNDAILACDSEDYITYTVSQIAKSFNVTPSGLGNQLRMHFPEILERRRNARSMLGLKNHLQESVVQKHVALYNDAVQLLSSTDLTFKEVADRCNVSFTGLRQHVIFYHKDLLRKRFDKRALNKHIKQKGYKNGNNGLHMPMQHTICKYSDALQMYVSSALSIAEIASKTNVTEAGLSNYLNKWCHDIVLQRKSYVSLKIEGKSETDINSRYLKSTALKYMKAIKFVSSQDVSVAETARIFNLNADAFRQYLKKHYPELAVVKGKCK